MPRRLLLAIVTGAVIACSHAPSGGSPASATAPVLFIGLDGGDWQLLDEYIARGVMPNLARLTNEGTGGVLETIRPALSPLVWTTMMTGVSPIDHGILDFVQFNAQTGAKEPITSSARNVPAIWNMATSRGKRAAVLGLWATFPAEAINGVIVSDRLFNFLFTDTAQTPGTVSPPDREAWARGVLDRAQKTVDFPTMKAYLPWLSEVEYQQHLTSADPYAHPISALRRILIETRVYDDLGREAFQREHPDLTVVYLQGTDSVGHVFAPFGPPKQPGVSEEDFARYHDVPERYLRAIDAQLGEYRKLAEASHAVLMIASDHGFLWKDGRPTTLSSNASATAAKWHRSDGMYLLWGPGIAASSGHGARGSVEQVCATLLSLIGLPPGQAVLGVPLPGAPAATGTAVDYAAQYTRAPASRGTAATPADADALAKLKSLGYIGGTSSATTSPGSGAIRTPGSYNNEGVILKEHGKLAESVPVFDKALAGDPNLASALWNLSDALYGQKAFDRSDALLVRALGNDLPEGTKLLIGRAIGYQRAGQAERSLTLVDAGLKAQPVNPELWLFRGRYRVEAGNCAGAAADFQRAEQLEPRNAAAFTSEGLARMCTGERSAARKAFTRSLELDPNQPKVREFLNTLGRTP